MIGVRSLKLFFSDETGATAIEYGLIVAVLSLAVVGGISDVQTAISNLFADTNGKVQTAFN